MINLYFNIRDGKLTNQKAISNAFKLKDGAYELKITRKSKRSLQQNRYYWGACVKIIQQGLIDLGYDNISLEETHDWLKAKFNYLEIVNERTGEIERIPKSTAELGKEQFGIYIERIQQFAAEYLNVVIPSPNEQLYFQYE